MSEHRVAAAKDIPEGKAVAVDVGDKRLAIFRYRGEYFALDETCPHRGAPLHEGSIDRGVVVCPWHQWQFALDNGCSPLNPLSKVQTYRVRVDGDAIFVDI